MTAATVQKDQVRELLAKKFAQYNVSNLNNISASEFEAALRSRVGMVDPATEGYSASDLDMQRDLSVKYHWGHTHDFGSFKLDGRMLNRHLDLMGDFIELFPVTTDSFADRNILDVGCWTGGTTLLLAAFANHIYAIEEVKKYAETVNFLAQSFGLESRIECQPLSIYQCDRPVLRDRFNIVYFPGVIYHLSDPVLALRILYNALQKDGEILVESAGLDSDEPICRFEGSGIHHTGTKEELSRGGWNWFMPSASALERMMIEAGFEEVETCWLENRKRVYGYGKKKRQVGICRAGLSVPDIK